MKACTKCGSSKKLEDFYRNKNNPDGRAFECKDCAKSRDKTRYSTEQRRISKRNSEFRRLYGISEEEVSVMYTEQGGVCKICEAPMEFFSDAANRKSTFCVDHHHETGKVRGLLCHTCNRALGLLKDNATILRKAAEYLEGTKC